MASAIAAYVDYDQSGGQWHGILKLPSEIRIRIFKYALYAKESLAIMGNDDTEPMVIDVEGRWIRQPYTKYELSLKSKLPRGPGLRPQYDAFFTFRPTFWVPEHGMFGPTSTPQYWARPGAWNDGYPGEGVPAPGYQVTRERRDTLGMLTICRELHHEALEALFSQALWFESLNELKIWIGVVEGDRETSVDVVRHLRDIRIWSAGGCPWRTRLKWEQVLGMGATNIQDLTLQVLGFGEEDSYTIDPEGALSRKVAFELICGLHPWAESVREHHHGWDPFSRVKVSVIEVGASPAQLSGFNGRVAELVAKGDTNAEYVEWLEKQEPVEYGSVML
jgi:hypothetical protein